MKRLLSISLLVVALLGLFGEQAALAVGPAWHPMAAPLVELPASGSTDCMEMMTGKQNKTPCKGLTLDCIAAMGCVVSMTLTAEQPVIDWPAVRHELMTEVTMPVLAGRKLPPELEPPSLLA